MGEVHDHDEVQGHIAANARLVIEQLGPDSGIAFGVNRDSVAWVQDFVERQRARPDISPELVDGLVNMLGSFLGECIAAAAPGRWHYSEDHQTWGVQLPGNRNVAYPFAKVRKQFDNGVAGGDSILAFYDTALLIAAGKFAPKG